MVLNDLVDSFCYSQKNAGLKRLTTIRVRMYGNFYKYQPNLSKV